MRTFKNFRLIGMFSLVLSLFSACDQIGIGFPDSPKGGGTAAIFITDPPDGTHASVGQIVDITSEATTPSSAFAVHLMVNNQLYYFDQMYQDINDFQILQPWTPSEQGVYTIQTIIEEKSGNRTESNTITIYVDGDEENPEQEPEKEAEEEAEQPEEECPQPIATTHSYANCRSGPGTGYDLVVGLKPNQSFPIVGKSVSGTWWQVEGTASGTCWIWEDLVEICGDTADVQVVSVQEKDEVIEEEVPEDPSEEPPEPPLPIPPAAFSACHDYPDFGTCTSDPMGFGGCSWDTGQNQCVP